MEWAERRDIRANSLLSTSVSTHESANTFQQAADKNLAQISRHLKFGSFKFLPGVGIPIKKKGIRVDPTIVGCPTAVAHISRSVLLDDKQFMSKMKAALNGKLHKREQAYFQKMRLVLQVLSETEAAKLTDENLHQLFVEQLRLYTADSKSEDVMKNLRKFANQYLKGRATT